MDGIKPGSDYRFTLAASFKWMTFSGGTVWSPKALLQQSYASLAMKPRGLFSIPTLVLIFATPLAAAAEPTQSVSNAALASAGRQATLKMIDYGTEYCDGASTVEAWLKALVGTEARSITWSGGQCVLVNDMRPGIDASSWPYCAQATIALVHPKDRDDSPLVEIYLEKPAHGRPGAAYAFRSLMMTCDDGPDYGRFRKDFEAPWDERFPPGAGAQRCKDE